MCGRVHAGATRQHSQQAGSGGATKDPAWAAAGPALEVEAGMMVPMTEIGVERRWASRLSDALYPADTQVMGLVIVAH